MKLVTDWKLCWRWFSVQAMSINMAFLATWGLLPAKFQDALPTPWVIAIAVVLLVAGVLGRIVDQEPKS